MIFHHLLLHCCKTQACSETKTLFIFVLGVFELLILYTFPNEQEVTQHLEAAYNNFTTLKVKL